MQTAYEIVQKQIQNPHASAPLIIPIMVVCNTSDADLERNIRANSALDLPWVSARPAHDVPALIVGGGPSVADCVEDIRALKNKGAVIYAVNAASHFLRRHGIEADHQVIADAKPETATLVDPEAKSYLFASQVDEATIRQCPRAPTLWHLEIGEIEDFFPAERKRRGGYVLLGGGAATGNSALCLAYALGHRELHVFGMDSSHRAGESHAYRQAMNDLIPTVDVEWAGRTFESSVAMKAQAEKFQMTAAALRQEGCSLHVHGDGLLQHMYRARYEDLTERDKYKMLWRTDAYRAISPGELTVDAFLNVAKPDGLILDIGCGTGRAALAMANAGHEVYLIDFTDNCRDEAALHLPFLEWDLRRPLPPRAPYGFCSDVMEHIPPEDVDAVLANIFEAARNVFFRIDTEEDDCGAMVGGPLHVSVHEHAHWHDRLSAYGNITLSQEGPGFSLFYVERPI